MRATGRNPRKVYLDVLVVGKPVDCLLDTGSDLTLIPGSLVQELQEKPIVWQIRATSGTLIDVLDEVDLSVVLKGREVIIRWAASDHVAELLLGIDIAGDPRGCVEFETRRT